MRGDDVMLAEESVDGGVADLLVGYGYLSDDWVLCDRHLGEEDGGGLDGGGAG